MSVKTNIITMVGYKIMKPTDEQVEKYNADNPDFGWDSIYDGMGGECLYFGSLLSEFEEHDENDEVEWSMDYILKVSKNLSNEFILSFGKPCLITFRHYK